MAVATDKPKRRAFFTPTVHRYNLDEEFFIEHKPLDEGLFQDYQDLTSRITLDRTGEHTELDVRPGAQRKFLLENLVTSWNLVDEEDKPVVFSTKKLFQLPPDLIQGLVDDIYKKNKVLGGEDEEEEGKPVTKSARSKTN